MHDRRVEAVGLLPGAFVVMISVIFWGIPGFMHSATATPPFSEDANPAFLEGRGATWQAKTDPVLQALLPKTKLKPVQTLSPEFRALLK